MRANYLVLADGFEPPLQESESWVLPLDDTRSLLLLLFVFKLLASGWIFEYQQSQTSQERMFITLYMCYTTEAYQIFSLAPADGLEPPTNPLTADRSTIELRRNILINQGIFPI